MDYTSAFMDLFASYNTGSRINMLSLVFSCGITGLAAMLFTSVSLILLLTLVRRGKAGTLRTSTFIYWCGRKIAAFLRSSRWSVPPAAKVFVFYILYAIISSLLLIGCITAYRFETIYFTILILFHIVVLLYAMYWVLRFRQLCNAAEYLRAGETDKPVNTAKMPPDLKHLGDALNNISEGLSSAVEKQTRSERFKAELITNVSHDLKTPLTSIINYVDLLKSTDISDPAALAYIDVLSRKSQSLKKLTEDLIEASKASSGALPATISEVDLCQLLTQALGEYDVKLKNAALTPVANTPEPPVMILADGRHLWRILDNLLGNCVKYAMPHTRIFATISIMESSAVLEIKNVSAEPLELTEEELTERFVRGDSSRSTEGSGLGLSITRSLTELMHGTFQIDTDGDLFRAVITLPLADA